MKVLHEKNDDLYEKIENLYQKSSTVGLITIQSVFRFIIIKSLNHPKSFSYIIFMSKSMTNTVDYIYVSDMVHHKGCM